MTNSERPLPILIAEIGVNYYDIARKDGTSPLDAAKRMISEAKCAGVDVAKFQTYKAAKLAAAHSPAYWDTTEETTKSQRELFSKFDKLTDDDYRQLAHYCKEIGIEFMSTPFDVESACFINDLVNRHKIASADITNVELLSKIGAFKKPLILSTGASSLKEIESAVELLKRQGTTDITLLHCVLCYPTAPHQASLWKIGRLKAQFPDCRIGYSDHTRFNSSVLTAAYLLGATVIEKHFTLDKTLKGNDHYHAADPNDLIDLRKDLLFAQTLLGRENDFWYAPEEEPAREFARRGIYLAKDVKKGGSISSDDVEFLRPQLDGLQPHEWFEFLSRGARYAQDFPQSKLLTREDIVS